MLVACRLAGLPALGAHYALTMTDHAPALLAVATPEQPTQGRNAIVALQLSQREFRSAVDGVYGVDASPNRVVEQPKIVC
jgi:hypothetical protein